MHLDNNEDKKKILSSRGMFIIGDAKAFDRKREKNEHGRR